MTVIPRTEPWDDGKDFSTALEMTEEGETGEALGFAVLGGRQAGVGLEEFVEDGLVGEVELVDDLLDGDVGVLEHVLGLEDDEGVNPVGGAAAAGLLDQLGQVFRRQAEFVGVEGHAALAVVVLGDELDETVEQLLDPHGGGGGTGLNGRVDVLGPELQVGVIFSPSYPT